MTVAKPERIAELDVIVVDVGNPHAVVIGDPDDPAEGRAAAGDSRTLSEQDERPGRASRRTWRGHGARVGARVGETQARERASPSPRPPRRGRRARPLSRR